MTRFSFGKCPDCGRLNIYGARCVCNPPKPVDCDCQTNGNRQIVGPKCQQRINDAMVFGYPAGERMTWRTTVHAPFDETQEHGSKAEAEAWAADFHARTGEPVAIWDDEQGEQG